MQVYLIKLIIFSQRDETWPKQKKLITIMSTKINESEMLIN